MKKTELKDVKKQKPLSAYVLKIHGSTMSELCEDYPTYFKMPVWNGSTDDAVKDMLAFDAVKFRLTTDLAKKFSKKPELGDFIPCDDEGNVYADEETVRKSFTTGLQKLQYEAAKQRVIYKGFELKKTDYLDTWNAELISDKVTIFVYNDTPDKTTEQLRFELEDEVELTSLEQLAEYELEIY